jgi:hypothetical protein
MTPAAQGGDQTPSICIVTHQEPVEIGHTVHCSKTLGNLSPAVHQSGDSRFVGHGHRQASEPEGSRPDEGFRRAPLDDLKAQ